MRDIDLMDAGAFTAGVPYDYFRHLRGLPGLHRAKDAEGYDFWYLVRHADVARASKDTDTFRSGPSTMTSVRQDSTGLPLISFLDAPEHSRLRRLVAKGFTPARLAALEQPVAGILRRILDDVTAKDEFDLAEDIAMQLPMEVLTELIGVPAGERDQIIEWGRSTVNLGDPGYRHSTPEKAVAAFQNLMAYFRELAERRAGKPADDLFSVLLAVTDKDDSRLEPQEIALFATTLIGAGSETTYGSITGGVLGLLDRPDQVALLRRRRELIPAAVDEIVRWVTPVTHFARQVAKDTEIGGQSIAAGERVVLWYTSANRDESVFDRPDELLVTRRPNPHVSFGGGGPHVCIGRGLAVLELRLFLEAVIDRLPRLELTGEPVRSATNFMNSFRYVPARFRRTGAGGVRTDE
uniref:Putative cytochrome P450 dependend hydroxylase n=1 Tax=Streptomyces tendae TaxID=1932 RepID=A7DWK5_STRTE|nr:putative cytochrome P450 dependend hydroxylase [Streptomyces tendae]